MPARILLVGESPAVSRFVENVITQAMPELAIDKAGSASEALGLASRGMPAAVLLNIPLSDSPLESLCTQLGREVRTGLIPIVVFHSEDLDTGLLQNTCPNVVATLQKPFSPEQLLSVLQDAMRGPEIARKIHEGKKSSGFLPSGMQNPKLIFRSTRDLIEPCRVLEWISSHQKSGILRLWSGLQPLEWYFHEGQPLLITTRDLATYSSDAPIRIEGIAPDILATAAKGQMDSGAPCFLLLAHRGALSFEDADLRIREYGIRLLSRMLRSSRIAMEFESYDTLPELARGVSPDPSGIYEILLAALRALPESTGAARFEMEGTVRFVAPSEILSILPPLAEDETEWLHAALQDGSLAGLSKREGWDWPRCATMVDRMTGLGVFAYLPPTQIATE